MVAFTVGALLPFPHGTVNAPSAAGPATVATLPPGRIDVRLRCSSVQLGSDHVAGHSDLLGVVRGKLVEERNAQPSFSKDEEIVLAGWAAKSDGSALAKAVCLVVDGKLFRDAEAHYGFARLDIATMFHNPADLDAGFQIRVPAARLSAGAHHLRIAIVLESGWAVQVPQTIDVTVR